MLYRSLASLAWSVGQGTLEEWRTSKAKTHRRMTQPHTAKDSPDLPPAARRLGASLRRPRTPPAPRAPIHALVTLYDFLNRTASSEPPVALPALYECAPAPASLPP